MKPGYARDGDTVTLTMTLDDFQTLLICIGLAAGAMGEPGKPARGLIGLANRLNVGNPQFVPYDLTPPDAAAL
jgi:hypothetical protein